ncbi:MAG: phosphoglucosamine mutase, partial [Planctomycetota bacterium]
MPTEKKIFGTDGIRDTANRGCLTPEFLLKLGRVLGTFLNKNPASFQTGLARLAPDVTSGRVGRHVKQTGRIRGLKPTVIIGRDQRISGQMIGNALSAGILAAGIDVVNAGVISTPGLAYLTRSAHYSLGVMISASHNPAEDNGIKLLSPEGLKIPDALELKIEKELTRSNFKPLCSSGDSIGTVCQRPQEVETYIKTIIKNVTGQKFSLKGFKIVLDCSNGATSDIAPKVFTRLGARVITLNNKPDGQNINRNCGSLYPAVTARAVIRHKAHIGFSFDGDGDRV